MFLAWGAVRLLVITQTVDRDDPILGFFHEWLVAFARRVEKLTVLCLNARLHDLPNNTEVLSLGKDEGKSRVTFVARLYRFAWARRHDYDVVFVHMKPYLCRSWRVALSTAREADRALVRSRCYQRELALLHGPEQIADLPVPVGRVTRRSTYRASRAQPSC